MIVSQRFRTHQATSWPRQSEWMAEYTNNQWQSGLKVESVNGNSDDVNTNGDKADDEDDANDEDQFLAKGGLLLQR